MEDKIDLIIGGIFFLFFIIGCFKGFFKSIIGPISLIACGTYAIIHYNQTQKFFLCITIGMLGPIILNICISILLKVFRKMFNREENISGISRFAGGLISLSWRGFYFVLMILLVVMIPIKNPKFVTFKKALKDSSTYKLAKLHFGDKNFLFTNLEKVSSAIEDPQIMKEISQSKKFKDLLTNSKVQTLYEDPEIQELITDKNYTALITNPKIQKMMQDKDLMLAFTEIINEHSAKDLNDLPLVEEEY